MRRPAPAATFAVLLLCVVSFAGAETNWPQFRGPGGHGVSDATGLPVKWGEGENVAWKTAVHGRAWSSPVVWGQQVWVTTATEDGRDVGVVCVTKGSGKDLHSLKQVDAPGPRYASRFNSNAAPRPARPSE